MRLFATAFGRIVLRRWKNRWCHLLSQYRLTYYNDMVLCATNVRDYYAMIRCYNGRSKISIAHRHVRRADNAIPRHEPARARKAFRESSILPWRYSTDVVRQQSKYLIFDPETFLSA